MINNVLDNFVKHFNISTLGLDNQKVRFLKMDTEKTNYSNIPFSDEFINDLKNFSKDNNLTFRVSSSHSNAMRLKEINYKNFFGPYTPDGLFPLLNFLPNYNILDIDDMESFWGINVIEPLFYEKNKDYLNDNPIFELRALSQIGTLEEFKSCGFEYTIYQDHYALFFNDNNMMLFYYILNKHSYSLLNIKTWKGNNLHFIDSITISKNK